MLRLEAVGDRLLTGHNGFQVALDHGHWLAGSNGGYGRQQVRTDRGGLGLQHLIYGCEHVAVAAFEEGDDGIEVALLRLAGEQAGLLEANSSLGLAGLSAIGLVPSPT